MTRLYAAIFAAFVLALASCAPTPIETPPEMYWPTPPEKPRIKFVDYIIGSQDAKGPRKGKFKEIIFGVEGETTFIKPTYVKVQDEVMFVNDVNRIQVYDFKHKKFYILQSGFVSLTGIGITDDGKIFVGDSIRRSVYLITPGKKRISRLPQPPEGLSTVGGIAIDNKNNFVYVVDARNHRVVRYNTNGKYLRSFGSRGVEPGKFNYPYDVAVDNEGFWAVLDSGNFRVQVFSPDGEVVSTFGKVGTLPGMFARPRGLAFDNDGHIYVADAAFGNFQIFDYQGNVYLFVGKNGSAPGQFFLPMGIYVDKKDRVYVVDQANKRVQIFQYLRDDEEEENKTGNEPAYPSEAPRTPPG